MLFVTHSAFTVNPLLHDKLPYDPQRDAAPITLAVDDILGVVAAPSLPVSDARGTCRPCAFEAARVELLRCPGSPYLAYLAFQQRAGIETTYVPYRNFMNALPDLANGRIHVMVLPFAAIRGAAEAGTVKLLAVTNAQRAPAAPNVPTVARPDIRTSPSAGCLASMAPRTCPAMCANASPRKSVQS